MANFLDFTSDRVNVYMILVDASRSMRDDERNVENGLASFKASFKGFSEAGSIAISISRFNSDFYGTDFRAVSDINTSYSTGGFTALYLAIREGAKLLQDYMQEIINKKHINPRASFILLSDGQSEGRDISEKEAKKVVQNLNYLGVTTAFVAFGSAITSEFGKEMGFLSTLDVLNKETLAKFFGEELSQSVKEQSTSRKSLGKNFFSQAAKSSLSDAYSTKTQQVLEDDSWVDDI